MVVGRSALRTVAPAPLTRAMRRAIGERKGAAILEFAFVMPVLLLIFAGIVQFGMALFLRSSMLDTAQDAARRMAVGELTTSAQVASFVSDTMTTWATPTVAAHWPNQSAGETDVAVSITVPLSEAIPFDLLGLFDGAKLPAYSVMRMEGL